MAIVSVVVVIAMAPRRIFSRWRSVRRELSGNFSSVQVTSETFANTSARRRALI